MHTSRTCEDGPVPTLGDETDWQMGRTLAFPTLALWSLRNYLEALYSDVLSVWRLWAPDLRGRGLDCGHYMAEEAPEELARELLTFLAMESRP